MDVKTLVSRFENYDTKIKTNFEFAKHAVPKLDSICALLGSPSKKLKLSESQKSCNSVNTTAFFISKKTSSKEFMALVETQRKPYFLVISFCTAQDTTSHQSCRKLPSKPFG